MVILCFGPREFAILRILQARNYYRTSPISQGRSEGLKAPHVYEQSPDAVALSRNLYGLRRGGFRMRQKTQNRVLVCGNSETRKTGNSQKVREM
jgi:hypothetical protein